MVEELGVVIARVQAEVQAVDLSGLAGRLKKDVVPEGLRQRGLREEAWLSREQHWVPGKRAPASMKVSSSRDSLPASTS